MTKLARCQYVGFKLGLRVADRIALDYRPGNELDSIALHAVKNIVNTAQLGASIGIVGINDRVYVGTGE